jgi:DNA repair exonuclease SbcCD ATPase subunit
MGKIMKLEIEGVVGVSKAAIDIEGIAMVCGQTGAGKTTVADAARAVLTGNHPEETDG